MDDCEFCAELSGGVSARMSSIYGAQVSSRIVASSNDFVAIPTIGQLFRGSLLVVPRSHVETCAELSAKQREELVGFVARVTGSVAKFGHPVVFEHGSTAKAAGSCGIYHAHIHVVPTPRRVEVESLFPEYENHVHSLSECWRALAGKDHYLLIGSGNRYLYRKVTDNRAFPSQFFRQRLVSRFELDRPWDWRAYKAPELDLTETIKALA